MSRTGARSRAVGATFDTVREIAHTLPGLVEGTSYGTAAFHVGKRLITRLKEDGETIVIRVTFDERDYLMRKDPDTFYITDHYRDYPSVLVRLATVRRDDLRELLESAWRRAAPKRVVAEYDGE